MCNFNDVLMSCFFFKALVRDGFRCVISGQYDIISIKRSKELELELKRDRDSNAGASVCYSKCAHIFPESTNAKTSGNNADDKVIFFSYPLRSLFIY